MDTADLQADQKPSFSILTLDIYALIAVAVSSYPPVTANKTLLSLCRVSRAWCSAAQPALFRNPFLPFGSPDTTPPRTYHRLHSLLDTLRRRPDLAACIRSFDYGRYTSRCVAEVNLDRRLVSPLSVELVRACPNLRDMTVPFVVQNEMASLIEAMRCLPSLESFTLGEGLSITDPWVVNIDVDVKDQWGTAVFTRADLAALATTWPHLRRFVLQTRVRGFDDDEPIPWQLGSFELSLLKNVKLSFPYLNKLLSNCGITSSLRHLVLKEHQLHPPDLVLLVETYGASLKVLETTTSDEFTPNDPFLQAVGSSCPNLRRLRFGAPIYDLPFALHTLSKLSHLRILTLGLVICQPFEHGYIGLAEQVERFPALVRLSIIPTHHENNMHDNSTAYKVFISDLLSINGSVQGVEVAILKPL
ncbi:hypothetical protein JCM11251_005287 [Rhodosporidiobolus azoricus]